jgi:PleD family two-component response regulator
MELIYKNAVKIDYNKIYKEADNLLYEAKKSGRNQIKVNG